MAVQLKLFRSMLVLCMCLCSFFHKSLAGEGFSGVLSKQIDANVTCGSPPEVYYRTQEGVLHPRLRNRLQCDASNPKLAHPPENMIDGDLGTFWQSTASVDEAEIRIDLNQEIFGYEISVTFGDYRRPEQIAFRKSKDYGVTYEPWHYLVSPPAMEQCRDVFNMGVTYNPDKVDTVICQQYPNYFPLEYNETFTIDMNGRQRGDGSSALDYHSPKILSWIKITNLEITFTGLYQKFDRLSTAWHHYAVREIGLTGKCNCNGYADGFNCLLNSVSRKRECKCQGNTCGLYCEQCCPAFNQYPWQQGNGAPWMWNGTMACEACNCYNHSDICVYNQTVADKRLSLDMNGQRRGGGVCVNCKHNTDGVNCEKCKKHYYRPVNQSKTLTYTCEECGCNMAGTLNLPNMTYLDCVRDEFEIKLHGGKTPGDCYCKKNVIGRTCSMCKDEFYELKSSNTDGCQGCHCHLPGTVNRSDICEKGDSGQCLCKANTQGRNCAQCRSGFYNLRDKDTSGCEDCGCDPGAAVPATFCNNITGTCECFPHIYGKQCKRIETGCYYPDLHYISAGRNIYQPASPRLSVLLDVPKSGYFRIMIAYSLKMSENSEVDIQFLSTSDHTVINSTSKTFLTCLTYCHHRISSSFLYLNKGKVRVVVNSSREDLKLEKVVAIPKEFFIDTVLGARASSHFQFQCNIDDNDMRVGTDTEDFCLSNVFSLTIAYNEGPLNCSCNPIGSFNHSTCDPHGGQCYCKLGITGRDCSQCLPEFYNFSNSGCSPCNCQGGEKLCNLTTGWCQCPSNTISRTCQSCECNGNSDTCLRSGECLDCKNNSIGFNCEKCSQGTYGSASTADCKDCKCHGLGSVDGFCDIVTGQCSCKANIVGRNCTECRADTYNMGGNGCDECQCNPHGTSSLQCNDTGQCPCLANVEGRKCTHCVIGYYGLPEMACQACDCSSIGSVNGTICSNDVLGKCVCKPGVSGRACDTCQKHYTDLTVSGCSRCPACPRNLHNELNGVIGHFVNVSKNVEKLQNFGDMDDFFQKTIRRVEIAELSRDAYADHIDEWKKQCQARVLNFSSEFLAIYSQVDQQNKRIRNVSQIIDSENGKALEKVSKIHANSKSSKNFTKGIHEFLDDMTKTLSNLIESTTDEVNKSQTLFLHLSNISLEDEVGLVQETLKMAKNLSQSVEDISVEVMSQEGLARALELSMNEAMKYFTENQTNTDQDHDDFINKIRKIYGSFSTATELIDSIKKINEKSKIFIGEATTILQHSDNVLYGATENLEKADESYQKYKDIVIPVSGELEISMLQYDFKESVFLMKILQARELLGRDFPSGLSDPYAIISIIPAWRNQGSQKSRIINGTTSPVFPSYDIYRFNIKVDEIPQTKVIIALFDYDADGVDDSLGEVVIDLVHDDFFNRIVTKWFNIQPRGATGLNSGDFNANGISLRGMTTLIQIQIQQLAPTLTFAESKLTEAKVNVTNLRHTVDSLNGSFQEALMYTRKPMESISRYESVSKMINDVMNQANETKLAVNKLMDFLSQKSVEAINHDFEMEYKKIQEFLQATLLRNLTYLENAIASANRTFTSSLPLWRLINQYLPKFHSETSQFKTESLKDASIREHVFFATNVSHISLVEIRRLTNECENLTASIDVMMSKIALVLSANHNRTKIISEGIEYITKAESTLVTSPNPSENVLAALPLKDKFDQTRDGVAQRISVLEAKLTRIMNISKTFNFAMNFLGNGAVVFTPSELFSLNKLSEKIVFDLKTNSSRGGLIYVITSQNDLSKSHRVFISDGLLCSSTDLGLGPNTLCHPERVDSGAWYRALFTRYGSYYSLTIIGEDGQYTTVNMTSTQNIQETTYNKDTVIYLGGLPSGVLTGVVSYYGYYHGVIDHLQINTDRFLLWSSQNKHGEQLYHSNRLFPKHPPGPTYEASFFGTGSLYHKLGEFSLNVSKVVVEFQFRSLRHSGVLLQVQNTTNVLLFGVYLLDGSIKVFLRMDSWRTVTLSSRKSSYDNGIWHSVAFNASDNTAALTVKTLGSTARDIHSIQLTGNRPDVSIEDGSVLIFGGANVNSSGESLTRLSFAGDMKNIRLSTKAASKDLVERDLVGREWIKDKGVSYEGMINGKIYSGYRFYGYLPYKGHGSYAAVTSEIGQVSHIHFTFKTVENNGVLFYSSNKTISKDRGHSNFFYIALWDGYLYISFQSSDFKDMNPFYYKDRKLNDNMWHTVSLNFTDTSPHLDLNGKNIHTGWFGNARASLVLSRPFYVGGVDPKVHIILPVPVYWSFQGAFQTFFVNSRKVNLLSGESEGVSIGGVSAATVVPTSPPTIVPTAGPQCEAAPGRPQLSSDVSSVRFGATSFEYNSTAPSYIAFNLSEKEKGFFKSSIVITLEMRSLTMNGLIFYAADNESNPKNFISLELVDGRLRYQFTSATGQVTIETTRQYALDGLWYKVYLLRIYQFGAIVIPQTKEYHNNRHLNSASIITISTPLYIGGLPSHVTAPSLMNRNHGFVGCLGNFEMSSSHEDVGFDMTHPDLKGSSIGQCYDQLEPGAYFNGNAWMKFHNVVFAKDFTISLRFRTYQRSGLLFALDASKGRGLVVQQKLGQLVLNYTNTSTNVELTWRPSSSSASSVENSFVICQMNWYDVKVTRKATSLTMIINEAFKITEEVSDISDLAGTLFLGQLSESELTLGSSPFYGCLKELILNGVLLDLSRPASQASTQLSCPVDSELIRSMDDVNTRS